MNDIDKYFDSNLFKFVPMYPINSMSLLVQVIAKPLPDPMVTEIVDAIWCHKATMS